MKTLAICNPYIQNVLPDSKLFEFLLSGDKFTIGLIDVPEPDYSRFYTDNSVLVQTQAFSCNYRDKAISLLFNQECRKLSKSQKYFYSPFGSEFVGEVIKTGANVDKFKVGDRVIPNYSYPFRQSGNIGGVSTNYASQRIQLFDSETLIKIPNSMPIEVAASFTIAAQTVYSMLCKVNIQASNNVLITAGRSNTSLAAIEALKHKNCNIYVISSGADVESYFLSNGVKKIIPFSALKDQTIKDLLNGILFDVVIDPFFDLSLRHIVPYMNFSGRYITCGLYNQHPSFSTEDTNNPINYDEVLSVCIFKNISLIGNCLGSTEDLMNALSDYEKGMFDIKIDSIYTGDNIIPFMEKSFHIQPRFGKVVYRYDD